MVHARFIRNVKDCFYAIPGFLLFVFCAYYNQRDHYLTGFLLICAAVLSYFYITIAIADRNWLDIRAVFSAVWLFTIGLASLRLLGYQEVWQIKTWLILGLAYLVFPYGFQAGLAVGDKFFRWVRRHTHLRVGRWTLAFQPNRLYVVCIVVTLIGLITFLIGVKIKGFIPMFNNDPLAYVKFYTRFYIFSVASTVIPSLCYYTVKTQNLSNGKRIALYASVIFITFVFPTLVVARGVFVTSAILLMTSVFYLNKNRLSVLVLSVLVIGSVYGYASSLRNLTDSQLDVIFEPISIVDSQNFDFVSEKHSEENAEEFKLSPKMSFLYSYLTVSHDNFNEAVQNSKDYSYGIRQFKPFNVVFRFKLPEVERAFLVKENLNTYNIIGDVYYDFHEFGIGFFTFLWALIFGAIQRYYQLSRGPFALLALGNFVSPAALSFFSPLDFSLVCLLYTSEAETV